jgi:hypothetical protein
MIAGRYTRDGRRHCRVCGYEDDEEPWGADGRTPSFEICPCCGVEYGYEDSTVIGIRRYRESWIRSGAPWSSRYIPSDGLTFDERISRVPREHR